MKHNLTTMTDSYKLSHHQMYPEGISHVYSYFEARPGAVFNKTVFFGLKYLLKEYLSTPITQEDIDAGEAFTNAHMGNGVFNREMWEHILTAHKGFMPLRICAVPEGTPVDVDNVLMTVENTDPLCAPLTNHFETLLSHVWAPSTVATLSYEVKQLCRHYLKETVGNEDALPFMLHDFGFRGVNMAEAASISGAGHLINFMGSDTTVALNAAIQYYDAPMDGLAYSVPASEHSVMTSLGKDGEEAVFKHLLDTYPSGILSVVIDSYDYRNFIERIAIKYKDQILARDGKVVFRPDSGDPNTVTLEVLDLLSNIFGSGYNDKGHIELNKKVGVLWGDGIDYQGIRSILYTMRSHSYAANNIVFGMGGGLLQKINRDTQRFAFKCSANCINGEWRDVYKKPMDTSKASKRGRLGLDRQSDGRYVTVAESENTQLKTVFLNGCLLNMQSFDDVRRNASQ